MNAIAPYGGVAKLATLMDVLASIWSFCDVHDERTAGGGERSEACT